MDPETVRWMIGGVAIGVISLLGGMAGIIKTMVVARFKSLDGTVNAHFLATEAQSKLIEKKLDEIQEDLTSKIEELRSTLHDLDVRLSVLERDHDRLTQCRYPHTEGDM